MSTSRNVMLVIGAAALGAISLAGASLADGKRGYHRGGHHGGAARHERLIEQFDANQDGTVTQAEIDQVRRDRLAAFDQDGDGRLTLEEYQALWLDAMRERMVDRFQDLDDDGDAIVTVEEFVAPFDALVVRIDRNGDGAISRDDLRRGHRGPAGDRDDEDDDG